MTDIPPSTRFSSSTREVPSPMPDLMPLHWRPIASPAMALAMVVSMTGLAGCLEQTDDLLGTAPLPAIDPTAASTTWTGSTEPSLRNDQAADPWSRADWTTVQIAVPMGSTIHEPTYVDSALSNRGNTTAGRLTSPTDFPTSESALVVETDQGEVILAGLAAPFAAVLDLVESPIRMILTPPWTQSTGPQGGWVLLPRIRTVESGGAS